jgi:hypothetical protein
MLLVAACGGNDVDPRVIAGGGVGDGEIDGELNVYVIDTATEAPIAGAMVQVGSSSPSTDATGLVTFTDLEGKQSITVVASGYRSAQWIGVNGANVTIGLSARDPSTIPQATISGSLTGYDSVVATNVKVGLILYSQSDNIGDAANNLATPNNGNVCLAGTTCDFSVVTRAGTVSLVGLIVDIDGNGTPGDDTDDIQTPIAYAAKTGITVADGVNQTNNNLALIEAGNLENISIDVTGAPASLTERATIIGYDISADEVVQIPVTNRANLSAYLVPKPAAFGATGYRLSAIAQTASGDRGAQSIVLRRGLTGPALSAGEWVVPPTGVSATRTTASFTPTAGAKAHSVTWETAAGDELFETTIFDETTSITVPASVTLPAGALRARVSAIGATFDVNDFSLDEDIDQLYGLASEPVEIE